MRLLHWLLHNYFCCRGKKTITRDTSVLATQQKRVTKSPPWLRFPIILREIRKRRDFLQWNSLYYPSQTEFLVDSVLIHSSSSLKWQLYGFSVHMDYSTFILLLINYLQKLLLNALFKEILYYSLNAVFVGCNVQGTTQISFVYVLWMSLWLRDFLSSLLEHEIREEWGDPHHDWNVVGMKHNYHLQQFIAWQLTDATTRTPCPVL